MRVIHLSYSIPKPKFTDPELWLKRISFSVTVMESMAKYTDVIGIYHICHKGVIRKKGVEYHFTKYKRWQVLLPFQFNRYIKKLQPDAVIVHGLISPWQIIMLRWQLGHRFHIIVEHHAERPLKDIRQYLQRWADRYIKAYLFGSLELGMKWVERKQIRDVRKIKEIVGTSSIFYPIKKNVARNSLGIPGGKVFLWVGRLDANKDPWVVVKAFDRFAKANSDVSLFMIYSIAEGEIEGEDLLRNSGSLHRQIHLVGEVIHPQLLHWYNSADFIISSSHYEGSGIAVCEALSCGCIPILTNIPSFTMMTNNGRIGLLYPPGDEDALLDALHQSLQLDQPGLKDQVLEWFNAQLSSEATAKRILETIHNSTE